MRFAFAGLALFVLSTAQTSTLRQSSEAQGKAEDAYAALQDRLSKATSVSASLEVRMLGEVDRYSYQFLRKNYAKIVSRSAAIFQNGKIYFDFSPIDNEYWQMAAPANGLPGGTAFSLGGIVGFESIGFPNEPKLRPVRVRTQKWEGLDVSTIELQNPTDSALKASIHLDATSNLPVGWQYSLREFQSSGRVRDFKLNPPLKPANFAWTPPKGSKRLSIG